MTSSKEKYLSFCEAESLPIFVQPWYLDAVCGEANWQVALAEENNKVLAALPYYITKKGPFEIIALPWLCKMMGPYIAAGVQHTDRARKLMTALVAQLPDVAAFYQNFHYQVKDWLPFFWKQYQQTTAYSYLLDDLSDLDKVYANISTTYRNNKIKKAEKVVQLRTDCSLEDFYRVVKMTFTRQGKDLAIPFSFLEKLDKALSAQQAGQKFFAVDAEGQIHSVTYLVWDAGSAYRLISGDDPNLRNSGASIFLTWETIKYTKNTLGLNQFDFQGSMMPAVEKVRRSFGAKQVPYFQVWKEASKLYRWQKWLRGK